MQTRQSRRMTAPFHSCRCCHAPPRGRSPDPTPDVPATQSSDPRVVSFTHTTAPRRSAPRTRDEADDGAGAPSVRIRTRGATRCRIPAHRTGGRGGGPRPAHRVDAQLLVAAAPVRPRQLREPVELALGELRGARDTAVGCSTASPTSCSSRRTIRAARVRDRGRRRRRGGGRSAAGQAVGHRRAGRLAARVLGDCHGRSEQYLHGTRIAAVVAAPELVDVEPAQRRRPGLHACEHHIAPVESEADGRAFGGSSPAPATLRDVRPRGRGTTGMGPAAGGSLCAPRIPDICTGWVVPTPNPRPARMVVTAADLASGLHSTSKRGRR